MKVKPKNILYHAQIKTPHGKAANYWVVSILDTENDIKRRKGLAADALHQLQYIFKNKKLSISIKMRAFDPYISSIFPNSKENSELWTLTAKREENINSFHRRLILVLIVTWPKVIKNENVYEKTQNQKKSWTSII